MRIPLGAVMFDRMALVPLLGVISTYFFTLSDATLGILTICLALADQLAGTTRPHAGDGERLQRQDVAAGQLELERRIADRLRAQWIEVRGEVAMGADRLDQRRRSSDAFDDDVISDRFRRNRRSRLYLHGRWRRLDLHGFGWRLRLQAQGREPRRLRRRRCWFEN